MSEEVKNNLVLYRFFDDQGVLLYIGKSIKVWSRFTDHRLQGKFYPEASAVTLQRGFVSHADLVDAEAKAILDEQPRYNQRHKNPPKPPKAARRGEDPANDVIDPSTGQKVFRHPCGTVHFCGGIMHETANGRARCIEGDKRDLMIADRFEAGEVDQLRVEFNDVRGGWVEHIHDRVRRDQAKGWHPCFQCPESTAEALQATYDFYRIGGQPWEGSHPCGRKHFCGWKRHQNEASCRLRDENDFAIVDRLDSGESEQQVADSVGQTVEQVRYTRFRIQRDRESGVHGCIDCPNAEDVVTERNKQ